MIIKSMSRKEPSFEQLATYMASEKSDSHYDIHHHCFSRNPEDIISEFTHNSQLLQKRKNGNYLYHDIISISAEQDTDKVILKEGLREIALKYIEARCPQNMVYGCLHEDHEKHLHYHLMMSANKRGERNRLRLSKKQFDQVKRELEAHVLKHLPQLKQKEVMATTSHGEKMSVKGDAMKRRTGSLPRREEVSQTIKDAMAQTNSMDNFCFFLNERGYDFYVRGKNFGVKVVHENGKSKNYRFSTLGLHEEFQAFQDSQFAQREEEAFSITHIEPFEDTGSEKSNENVSENENIKPDASSFDEENKKREADFVQEHDDNEGTNTSIEKEKKAFKEQLKINREAGGGHDDDSDSSI